MKHYTKIILFTLTSFACGATLADNPTTTVAPTPAPAPGNSASLEAFLGTLYTDTMDYLSASDYQKSGQLAKAQTSNTAKTTPSTTQYTQQSTDGLFFSSGAPEEKGAQKPLISTPVSPTEAASLKAAYETASNLTDTLRQFPAVFSPSDGAGKTWTTVNGKPLKIYSQENSIQNLTVGNQTSLKQCQSGQGGLCASQASDTLFAPAEKIDASTISDAEKPYVKKPQSTAADSYLDFSSLMFPQNNVYATPQQETAAKSFLKYTALSTQDFTSVFNNADLTTLQLNPSALARFKQQSAYIHFMFDMRALLALRSMNLTALNQLIAERTPMPGLGVAAGIPNATAQTPASPLQVEAYQANHDFDSATFYQHIQNASPATIQREILVTLTEIKHQNYQAHIDRENILAAITAMNLQMSAQNMQGFIQKEKQPISEAMSAAAGKPVKK